MISIAQDMVRSMCYKMRIMGFPIYVETDIFSDNEAFWKISSLPEATIKKKHVPILFQGLRKSVASHVTCVGIFNGKITWLVV